MRGSAREMLVRSMKAMVYMMRATGMMRVQRPGAGAEAGGLGDRSAAWEAGCISVALVSELNANWRTLAGRFLGVNAGVPSLELDDCDFIEGHFVSPWMTVWGQGKTVELT